MDNQRKVPDPERPPTKRNRPQQLQTYNASTDDVNNIQTAQIEGGGDLQPQTVPWRTERMPKGKKRNWR